MGRDGRYGVGVEAWASMLDSFDICSYSETKQLVSSCAQILSLDWVAARTKRGSEREKESIASALEEKTKSYQF